MGVMEMRMIRGMCDHMRLDRLRNGQIRDKVRVSSIEDKMREAKLRLFGHARRMSMDALVRRCAKINILGVAGVKVGREELESSD